MPILLEQELQSELNQPGIRSRCGGRYYTKIGVVGGTAYCVRRSKLSPVKKIKNLHAEFNAEPLVRIKLEFLEDGEVEIVHSVGTQPRIDP